MPNNKDKPKQTPPLPFQKPEPSRREDSTPPPSPQPPENPFQHPDPLKKNAQDIPPKRDGRG